MLALSSSWISQYLNNGNELINSLQHFGVSCVELEYRISNAIYLQLLKLLPKANIKVASIHNYFPKPTIVKSSKGGGDLFRLSSPDREERQFAVHWSTKTIENAGRLGATAVVLHCGHVEMDMELDRLYTYYSTQRINSKEAQAFISQKINERSRLKPIYLKCLLSSLEKLVPIAAKHGVVLGIENRYHYCELPTLEDFETIFSRFKGGPIGYWHDTGHAHVNESLTLIPKRSLLETYSQHLIGVHIHDAKDLDDHLVPGTGTIDFKPLKNILKKNLLNILELKPGTSASGIFQAIGFAQQELGLFA